MAAASLLTGCIAVGPDFLDPAAPPIERYTKEKLAPRTSSTDAPTGTAATIRARPRSSAAVVASVSVPRAQFTGRAGAPEQCQSAIDHVHAAGFERGRVRPGGEILSARRR